MTRLATAKREFASHIVDAVVQKKARTIKVFEPSEAQVQTTVVRHLTFRAHPDVVWFHVPNGGSRHRIEAARMKGQGVVPGVPDIVIIRDGKVYGMEIKASRRGRLSPAQRAMHQRLERAGATVATAYGLDEAVDQLDAWGIFER